MDVVVGAGVVAACRETRIDALRRAEQRDRLVDEMRPEIVEQAAAARGLFAPARQHLRPETVECDS